MNIDDKQKYIEAYFNWFQYECSSHYDEIEFLINSALNGNEKQNIIDVLKETFKNYNQ